MASLPLATSRLRSIGEFVRMHEIGSVFDVHDPASIARAVRDVVERPPPGIADPRRVRALQEEVCWERQAQTLLDLYARLLRHARVADSAEPQVATVSGRRLSGRRRKADEPLPNSPEVEPDEHPVSVADTSGGS